MKKAILILLILFPAFLFAQETKKIKNKDKSKGYKEIYYVLKSDKSTKHGDYKKYNQRGQLIIEGNYIQGEKDGHWIEYSGWGKTKISEGNYQKNEKVGIWKFYNNNDIEHKYDYTNKKIIYFKPQPKERTYRILIDGDTIKTKTIDQPVIYLGGDRPIILHINYNIRYPAFARQNGLEGTVVVGITINEDGSPTDYKIVRGIEKGLDEEALRVIKLLPNNWIPAIYKGEVVKQQFLLPIKYKLAN